VLESQNIANNTSSIIWSVTSEWDASLYHHNYELAVFCNYGIVLHNVYDPGRLLYGQTVYSKQFIMAHGSDGTGVFVGKVQAMIESTDFNTWGESGWSLPTIARASKISAGQSTNYPGDPITFVIERASSSFTHTIKVYGNNTPSGPVIATFTGVGTSLVWTPTTAQIDAIYQAASAWTSFMPFAIECITYNGSAYVGTQNTYALYIQFQNDPNSKPIFDNFIYNDTNPATIAITGDDQYLIDKYSSLKVTIPVADKATATKYATMLGYIATVGGKSLSANYSDDDDVVIDFGTVNTSDAVAAVSVSARNSHYNETTLSKDSSILPYTEPVVVAGGKRDNNFDADTTIHIEGLVSTLTINGVNKNAVDANSGVKYRYKEQNGDWGDWTPVASVMGNNGVIGTTDFVLTLDNTKTYNFEATITDLLSTSTTAFTVNIGLPIFRIGLDGYVYNNEVKILTEKYCPYAVGDVYETTSYNYSTVDQVAARWPGTTWVAWSPGRVPVGVNPSDTDFNTVEKTGGAKTYSHQHLTSSGADSGNIYTRADNPYGSTVVTANRFVQSGGTGSGSTRVDYTNSVSVSALPPYTTCYMWKRTS
jgi:hypothetical protein